MQIKRIKAENYKTYLHLDLDLSVSEDSSSFGFAILGFFIPIVGLILFLIYEEKNPKRANN